MDVEHEAGLVGELLQLDLPQPEAINDAQPDRSGRICARDVSLACVLAFRALGISTTTV